jgi:hypothetical protein
MYESSFSLDWEHLSRDEAVKRAFALGVAAACGVANREEYDRVKATADTAYDRSLVELSFDQGRTQALQLESSGTESDAIWDQIVVSSTDDQADGNSSAPDILGPAELLDRFDQLDGPPHSLTKPSFLLRDDSDNV